MEAGPMRWSATTQSPLVQYRWYLACSRAEKRISSVVSESAARVEPSARIGSCEKCMQWHQQALLVYKQYVKAPQSGMNG
eukprot:scaffold358378_cov44-Prasinocladus_malaysianus.AAC.1